MRHKRLNDKERRTERKKDIMPGGAGCAERSDRTREAKTVGPPRNVDESRKERYGKSKKEESRGAEYWSAREGLNVR